MTVMELVYSTIISDSSMNTGLLGDAYFTAGGSVSIATTTEEATMIALILSRWSKASTECLRLAASLLFLELTLPLGEVIPHLAGVKAPPPQEQSRPLW